MSHTKGEWALNTLTMGGEVCAFHITAQEKGSTDPVCEYSPRKSLGRSGDEIQANGRLIAAAPEMLAALNLIYANAAESPEWIRERIGSVIAKAGGRYEPYE